MNNESKRVDIEIRKTNERDRWSEIDHNREIGNKGVRGRYFIVFYCKNEI